MRRACARAAEEFLAWCVSAGVPSIGDVQRDLDRSWDARACRASVKLPALGARLTRNSGKVSISCSIRQSRRFAPIVALPLEANDQAYPILIRLHFQEGAGASSRRGERLFEVNLGARLSRSRPIVRTASLRPLCR
jgi:hypothetical protein